MRKGDEFIQFNGAFRLWTMVPDRLYPFIVAIWRVKRMKVSKSKELKFMEAMRLLVDHFGFEESYIRGLGPDKVLGPQMTVQGRGGRVPKGANRLGG